MALVKRADTLKEPCRFPYEWKLSETTFTKDKGKVFSCFACGGGSTMGYKLAGFDVIGCNEIDPRMNKVYVENHHPKYNFVEGIQTFKLREDLPEELYNLDVLDGSPPCSAFSMSGQREKAWGKKKKFKEGQVAQVLDTLFFDFIDLAEKLQPKVVIAENVRGLLQGNAKNYVREIYNAFDKAGYYPQHFLLNGADMGLPQTRRRAFFVCLRKDLSAPFMRMIDMFHSLPHITMSFNCRKIPVKEICDYKGREIPKGVFYYWNYKTPSDRCIGNIAERISKKLTMFNNLLVHDSQICPTLASKEDCLIHYEKPLYFSTPKVCKISSFPLDYNFLEERPHYICGMSVPPIMMANVATNVYEQWLSKLK